MGKKLKSFGSYIWKNNVVWSIVIFVLIIGFIDTNSIWDLSKILNENNRLKQEITKYEQQCSRDSAKLQQLISDPEAVIKVARETHLMKSKDEDVYIVTVVPQQ